MVLEFVELIVFICNKSKQCYNCIKGGVKMKKTVGTRLDETVFKVIQNKAKKEDRTVSWMINKILKESIKKGK